MDDGSYEGRTAIDDIMLMNCAKPVSTRSCTSDEFTCQVTGYCVSKSDALCNGVDDCGDGTDESNCGN